MCDTFCSVLQLAALLVVHLIYTYPLSPHLYPAVHFMHVFNLHFLGNTMERLYMEAQDGLKTIAPPLFLNIFFYFLLV